MSATRDDDTASLTSLAQALRGLGDPDDGPALAAAREAARLADELALDWDSLLGVHAKAEEIPLSASAEGDRTMISALLKRPNLSEDTRQDLSLLLTDLGEGDFTEADRLYINALVKRLK